MTNINFAAQVSVSFRLLSQHDLFHGLADDVTAALAATATLQHANPDQLLFREGAPALHFLLIERGQVELLRYSLDGTDRVFKILDPGQLVAESAMFMPHGRYPMNARAKSAVAAWRLPRFALQRSCTEHPLLALRMLERLSQRLYQSVNEVEWLTASSNAQRLAAYLLDLHVHQHSAIVTLPLSQRQLAARLGMRAETLSRLLSDWAQQARIRGRQRCWILLRLDYLRDLASGSVRSF